jgi:hypothetical protein
MKKLWIILLTSVATLPLASVASADQVVTLSDAELDNVTGGAGGSVSAELTGDAIVFGAYLIGNLRTIGWFSGIVAGVIPISGVVTFELTATVHQGR